MSTEIKSPARDVRLSVIVPANLELGSEWVLVTPPQHGDAGRYVVLGVAVLNEALSLAADNVISKVRDARRRWSAHDGRDSLVVARRPTDCREVKSRILRTAVIAETADAHVQAKDYRRGDCASIPSGNGAAVVVLSAAVGTQAASQRIDGQVQYVPIAETDKKPLAIFDVMVHAPDHLVLVSTGAGDRSEIVGERSGVVGRRPQTQKFRRGGIDPVRRNDVARKCSGSGRATRASSLGVHAASTRVINLIDYNGVAVGVLLAIITDTTRET